MRPLCVYRLGLVEYSDGLALQNQVAEAVRQKHLPDTLLLLEHPPVLTLGRSAKPEHILGHPSLLKQRGIEVFETDRGGDVTYHGPGQVVGYPIFLLSPDRQDVRQYVRNLEESIILTLSRFRITAGRIPSWTGVWLGSREGGDARKIAAIGVHLSRWLTTHGFALNVSTDLSHFGLIVPCGIQGSAVTSIRQELNEQVGRDEVEEALVEAVCQVFGYQAQSRGPSQRTIAAAVFRSEGLEVLALRRRQDRGGFWQIITGKIERGEPADLAAVREVQEETGQKLPMVDLGYRHSFALGQTFPPHLIEETSFCASWNSEKPVQLDPSEHDAYAWLPVEEAVERMPYPGLKQTILRAASFGAEHLWGRNALDA